MGVPFLKPDLPPWKDVLPELQEVYQSGKFHPGKYVERFELTVRERLGVRHAVMFSTASDALILLMAWMAERGAHRVALPAFTFRATAQAIEWAGLDAVALDVGDDANLDPEQLQKALATMAIDAVLAVHCFGKPCDVERLAQVAGDRPVFYDSAHALGAMVRGEPVGGFGLGEVFSLNITKAIPSCGEGGVFTTNDGELAEWMRQARWHGDVPGSLDWHLPGMNAKPTEWQAVVAWHALMHGERVLMARDSVATGYLGAFLGRESFRPVQKYEDGITSVWKDFVIEIPDPALHKLACVALERAEIAYKRYFSPLVHQMAAYSGKHLDCPRAEQLAAGTICLPIYGGLSREQQQLVIDTLLGVLR